jgi:hypothetical protein
MYVEVLNEVLEERKTNPTEAVGSKVSSSGKDIATVRADYKQTKVRVVITDHDNNTSTEEELDNRVIPIRWGNKNGRFTDFVAPNGKKTHVRQGAIDILKDAVSPVNKTKSVEKKKRFAVTDVEPLTQEELERQAMEKASLKK